MSSQAGAVKPMAEKKKRKMSEGLKLLLLALPFVIFVFMFSYVPLGGWGYAFFDYRPGLSLADCQFVGLDVFAKIWQNRDELFRVLRNTLVLSGMGLLASPLPVIFAIILNEIKNSKFRKIVQTLTTLPNFISWIVVFTLAFAMFSSDGMFNSLFRMMGVDVTVNIMGNNKIAWTYMWALGTWKTLGWSAIIYIASIAGIDAELYDAAHVDGANRLQTILHVTVPGLYSTFFVLLLLAISNMLSNGFDQYFVFYNALTADKLEVLDYYVYKIGVLTNDYPQSVALGMFKTIISVILLFSANTFSKRLRGQSIV
ncbi:MAG TPA: sugar ABC transporter permease [Candidatus Scybalocola faecavium]|nr:sugar ABC transporter permease [Candidatus Scybalocola faecavium]